jgi:hypothetical protein
VRRGTHRIGARRLFLAFQILEKCDEPLERFELMGIDGQKMTGSMFQPVIAGEEDKRRVQISPVDEWRVVLV